MNSIETYSPPQVTSHEGDEGKIPDLTSDPAALEALRSLLGGIPPPLNGVSLPGPASGPQAAPAQLPSQSYKLNALVAELQQAFASQGDASSKPEVVAQMKTLLQALESADSGVGSKLPGPMAASADTDPFARLPALLHALQEATANPQSQTEEAQQVMQNLRLDLVKALTEATAPTATASAPASESPPEPTEPAAGLGNAILQSLGHQSSTAATPSPIPTLAAERVEHVSALIAQMADRVLVTDPVNGQNPEVRIKLADNVMPGTEVRVWREDGQLRVSFDTASPHWARVLNEASPLLAQRLNERLPNEGFAQVTVQQQGGQPEDGRSRNRHTAWELAQQAGDE